MARRWQLQEAKARLSEVVKLAEHTGPQEITVHGRPAAVVVSALGYERLTRAKASFVDFLRHSPLVGVELKLERHAAGGRDVEL